MKPPQSTSTFANLFKNPLQPPAARPASQEPAETVVPSIEETQKQPPLMTEMPVLKVREVRKVTKVQKVMKKKEKNKRNERKKKKPRGKKKR